MPVARELMNADFPSIESNASVSELLGVMRKWKRHWAVVLDGKKYVGMVDKKWLRSSRVDVGMKVRHCVVSVPRLSLNDGLGVMLDKAIDADVKAVPVFDKGVIVGVVPVFHLLKYLKPVLKAVKVSELVPRRLLTVEESTGISTALNLMQRNKLNHLPVVDKSGRLVGMLSFGDLLEKLLVFPKGRVRVSSSASGRRGKREGFDVGEKEGRLSLPVSAVMSRECCSCSLDSSVSNIIDLMYAEGHGVMVVTERQVPVGVVAVKDILVWGRKLL